MPTLEHFMETLLSKNGGELRNDDALVEAIAQTFAETKELPTPQPTIVVQRVDTFKGEGEYETTWEVADRRRPKLERVIGSFEDEQKARAFAAVRAPIGGGAYTYEAVDTDEYWHDTDVETIASMHSYGVLSGCTATPSASDLTVDLVAGVILHSGSVVAAAAATDAWTLVADGSNERWAALCVSSAGSAVLVSGDAAASSSVEPTKPEIGDRVLVEMYKIQAAQTIAANCEYQLDKRAITHGPAWSLVAQNTTEATMTSSTAADLVSVTTPSIAATTPILIVTAYRKSAATHQPCIGLKVNSTVVIEAAATGSDRLGGFAATNEAQDGMSVCYIGPRRSNYTRAISGFWEATGASAGLTGVILGSGNALNSAIPTDAVTAIVIRGDSDGTNTLGVQGVYVYAGL